MRKRACMLTLFFCLIILLPSFCLSFASIYIGIINLNTSCDTADGNIVRLSTWLFVNSGTALATAFIYIFLLLMFFCKEQYKYLIFCLIVYVLNWFFVIIWNVLGAVELFKDSFSCKDQAGNLWIMVLISLIFQWVGIFLIIFLGRCNLSNILEIPIKKPDESRPINIQQEA